MWIPMRLGGIGLCWQACLLFCVLGRCSTWGGRPTSSTRLIKSVRERGSRSCKIAMTWWIYTFLNLEGGCRKQPVWYGTDISYLTTTFHCWTIGASWRPQVPTNAKKPSPPLPKPKAPVFRRRRVEYAASLLNVHCVKMEVAFTNSTRHCGKRVSGGCFVFATFPVQLISLHVVLSCLSSTYVTFGKPRLDR